MGNDIFKPKPAGGGAGGRLVAFAAAREKHTSMTKTKRRKTKRPVCGFIDTDQNFRSTPCEIGKAVARPFECRARGPGQGAWVLEAGDEPGRYTQRDCDALVEADGRPDESYVSSLLKRR